MTPPPTTTLPDPTVTGPTTPTMTTTTTTTTTTVSAAQPTGAATCLSWEINQVFLFFLGLVGAAISLALWMAPIQDVWTAPDSLWRSRTTKRVATPFPYIASIFNCILWSMFAMVAPSLFVVPLILNAAGLVLNTSFTACYWIVGDDNARWWIHAHIIAFTVLTAISAVLWATVSIQLVGVAAAIVNTLMLFGPLAAAKQVVKARSTKGFPFPPLVLTLVTSVVWFLYSGYICNVQGMIPNGLGVIFGIAQLCLWSWARRQERSASATVAPADLGDVPPVRSGGMASQFGAVGAASGPSLGLGATAAAGSGPASALATPVPTPATATTMATHMLAASTRTPSPALAVGHPGASSSPTSSGASPTNPATSLLRSDVVDVDLGDASARGPPSSLGAPAPPAT